MIRQKCNRPLCPMRTTFSDANPKGCTYTKFCRFYRRPQTNGEILRRKSNQELASWLYSVTECEACPVRKVTDICEDCKEEWFKWLNTEI